MTVLMGQVQTGDALPERSFCPDEVQLFMYNAAIWNPHRIHYDHPYTTTEEGHPGVIIDGPLQGDFLIQLVLEWVGENAVMTAFEYSNRKPAYVGETLTAKGRVGSVSTAGHQVDLELAIVNQAGEVITPGSARVRFHNRPSSSSRPPGEGP